jgi:hypothetical protein
MSLALIVYLASISHSLCGLFGFSGVVLLIIFAVWCASCGPGDTETRPPKSLGVISIVLILLATLIPNKETIYTMVAAYTVQDIATSPKVQELGGKSLEVIEKVMDDYLKEVKPAKAEGEK